MLNNIFLEVDQEIFWYYGHRFFPEKCIFVYPILKTGTTYVSFKGLDSENQQLRIVDLKHSVQIEVQANACFILITYGVQKLVSTIRIVLCHIPFLFLFSSLGAIL